MKTILCVTDFSAIATNAARYASSLAVQLKSKLILIHAYENPVLFSEQPLAFVPFEDDQIRLSAEKKLNAQEVKLQKEHRGLEISTILLNGVLYDQLMAVTEQQKADMIVMGAPGSTGLIRLLTGSPAERVITEAHCPVLCIPKDAKYQGIKKIVFSTDLHEDNLGSATALTAFAKKFDAEIIFLYVDDKHLIHSDEAIERMTAKICQRIKYPKISGYISKDPHITKGISYFLKKHPADLLVMFTHRKHFPESFLHPSVTKTMSHLTKIPLLSMKYTDVPILSNA